MILWICRSLNFNDSGSLVLLQVTPRPCWWLQPDSNLAKVCSNWPSQCMPGVQIPPFVLDNEDCTRKMWVLASKYHSCNQAALRQSIPRMDTRQPQRGKTLQRKPRWVIRFTQFLLHLSHVKILKNVFLKSCIVIPAPSDTKNLQITAMANNC